ncbi:hypothetical protein NDU88_004247 [Pleurodeles waltl]|uniref:Uncharacterized protein n=1 Tax=Pleurodeles waltl TaxID=8319 RepID=A0AAV7NNT1_PLEWA|nr:hypothetical protein NDU88_004247 [Pleurodeles waltl]
MPLSGIPGSLQENDTGGQRAPEKTSAGARLRRLLSASVLAWHGQRHPRQRVSQQLRTPVFFDPRMLSLFYASFCTAHHKRRWEGRIPVSGVDGGCSPGSRSSTNHGCIAVTSLTHRSTSPVQCPSHPVSSLLSLGQAPHQSQLCPHQVLRFVPHSASQEKGGVQAPGNDSGNRAVAQTAASSTDPYCATFTPALTATRLRPDSRLVQSRLSTR